MAGGPDGVPGPGPEPAWPSRWAPPERAQVVGVLMWRPGCCAAGAPTASTGSSPTGPGAPATPPGRPRTAGDGRGRDDGIGAGPGSYPTSVGAPCDVARYRAGGVTRVPGQRVPELQRGAAQPTVTRPGSVLPPRPQGRPGAARHPGSRHWHRRPRVRAHPGPRRPRPWRMTQALSRPPACCNGGRPCPGSSSTSRSRPASPSAAGTVNLPRAAAQDLGALA